MRQKRILKRIIIAFCCIMAILPSNMVFATMVEEAKTSGGYNTLATIDMWLQAADYCVQKINSTNGYNDGAYDEGLSTDLHEVDDTKREKILEWINLSFKYKGETTMYSSLLEHYSENSGNGFFGAGTDDGKVWCSELSGLIFNRLLNFFSDDGAVNLKQTAACGIKDSESGRQLSEPLFKIKIEYGKEDWGGWTRPKGDYLTTDECNANYGKIVSILEAGGIAGSDDFDLTLKINGGDEGFSAFKWLKSYTGDLSNLDSDARNRMSGAMQYMTFETICKPSTITEEEYNGVYSGWENVYKIYDSAGNGKYVMLNADMVDEEVYANEKITNSSGEITCGNLAKSFGGFEWMQDVRYHKIMWCYNQHSQNVEELKKIKTYLSHMLTTANSLVANARSIKEKPYTGSEGPYGAKRIIEGYIRDSGIENSTVLRDLVNETETLEAARDNFYEWKWRSGTHSGREESEVIPAYNRAIEHYESYIEAFKADIVDKISDKVDAVPDFSAEWENEQIGVYIYEVPGFYHFDGMDIACIATQDDLEVSDEIEGILGGSIDISDYTPPTIDIDDGSGPEGETDPCYAGSGSLGWILCPVITAASGIGEFMWDQIESVLFVPVGEIFKDDNGVENAWKVIRDIANVIFIILFLAVIFSQLTGVGIDNYGIKKILPKLIVVAILVNLSYVICKVAIDISNIVGSGIDSMLSGFADSVVTVSGASTGWQIGSWLTTIAGGGAGVTIWVLLSEGGLREVGAVIGLAALGIVISILAAVTFMYIILGVRMAGVILCTVLSPVAIVCYALPNTEKIYKKWFDLFKALLVVYPICGAMIGMGQFAGAILASIPNGTMKLMAMIVQVVPFFFVPTLLKNSLSLMGNVGAKLSSMGKTFGRKGSGFAKNTIKGTDAYKRNAKFDQARKANRKAGRTVARLDRRSGGDPSKLSERQQAKMAAAVDIVQAQKESELKNKQKSSQIHRDAIKESLEEGIKKQERKDLATLMMSQTQGQGLEQLVKRWNDAFDDGNEDNVSALTSVINQRYGKSGASAIARSLNNKRGVANNSNYQNSLRALQRTMNDDSGFAGNMKVGSPDAFQMISDAGMRWDEDLNDGNGAMRYEDMSYFTQNNRTATKVSDWANVTGATLQRALDAGEDAISSDTVQRLLNSTDSSIVSGIQSERGKREALEAALYNRSHHTNLSNDEAARMYEGEQAELYVRQGSGATGGNGGNGNGGGGGAEPQPGPQPQPQSQPRPQSGSEGGGRIIISDNPNADWDALRGGRR